MPDLPQPYELGTKYSQNKPVGNISDSNHKNPLLIPTTLGVRAATNEFWKNTFRP
jgi:hypothetical protein